MNERKDEKWLDNQLQRAVDGTAPVFDAEAWKHKHAREFQTLLRRGGQPDQSGTNRTVWLVLSSPIAKLAIAATIIATAGILLVGRFEPGPDGPSARPAPASPAQMVSMISLSDAFRRGGIDELDRHCERALERLGPRLNSVSMQELFKDISSKDLERTNI